MRTEQDKIWQYLVENAPGTANAVRRNGNYIP